LNKPQKSQFGNEQKRPNSEVFGNTCLISSERNKKQRLQSLVENKAPENNRKLNRRSSVGFEKLESKLRSKTMIKKRSDIQLDPERLGITKVCGDESTNIGLVKKNYIDEKKNTIVPISDYKQRESQSDIGRTPINTEKEKKSECAEYQYSSEQKQSKNLDDQPYSQIRDDTVQNMIQEDDVGFVKKNNNNPGSNKLSDDWDDNSKEGREEVKGEVDVKEGDVEDGA